MSADLLAELEQALKGRVCVVGRRQHDWTLSFGAGRQISISAAWRIVGGDGIAHADTDDGQRFGLHQAVDGEARSTALLKGRQVWAVEVDRTTADLCLRFDDGMRLDVFNNSTGYEGWQAEFPLGNQTVTLIGLGGGEVDFCLFEAGSRPVTLTGQRLPRV
jgi:hypothetical protein